MRDRGLLSSGLLLLLLLIPACRGKEGETVQDGDREGQGDRCCGDRPDEGPADGDAHARADSDDSAFTVPAADLAARSEGKLGGASSS